MKGNFIKLGIYLGTIALVVFLLLTIPKTLYKMNSTTMYFFVAAVVLLAPSLPRLISKSLKANYKNVISLEEIPHEFESIYEDLYHNHIYSLESMRKKVRWRTVIQYIAYAVCIIGYIILEKSKYALILRKFDINITVIGFIAFIIAIAFSFMNSKYKRKYIESYKKEIVSSFIKLINNQLEYKPLDAEPFRTQDFYKRAGFDNKEFNSFHPDDYIEGFLDDETFIKMCDLHIQNNTGNGKSRHTEEIFQGIFAHTRYNKDIGTYVKISKNKLKVSNKQDRVEMDSEEFEKYFDIYSDNKVIAMQLLTSDIMESLIDFHNKYGLDYEIVFRNNAIYMRFFTGAMFEPKIFGSSMDKQLLFVYFCIMKFIVEITKKVNKTLQEIEI